MEMITGAGGAIAEAILLAGGKSSRMGKDKALLPVAGEPLLVHLVRQLQAWGMRVTIAAGGDERADQYAQVLQSRNAIEGVRFVTDHYPELGPLSGLHAALSTLPHGYAFVVACDMPRLSYSMLVKLAQHLDEEADFIGCSDQPFHALYHTRAIPLITVRLEAQEVRMMGLIRNLRSVHVQVENESEVTAFINLNSPEAYNEFLSRER